MKIRIHQPLISTLPLVLLGSTIIIISSSSITNAFTVVPPQQHGIIINPPRTSSLHMSSTVDTEAVALTAKESVIATARQCQDEFGLFLVDKTAKKDLAEAVEVLESTYDDSDSSTSSSAAGTWDLVCTTTTTTQGIDTKQFLPGPLKEWTDRLSTAANKYVTVQQIIKPSDDSSQRIDHVIAYQPPKSLTDVLENLPEPLVKLNVNPLDVSKSKLILVHKATFNNTKTSLQLQSVIWNVAGNSTYLDPAGKDITSINLPFRDFLGSGTFETTYMDDDLRIVRGKQGPLDFLRVFTKSKEMTGPEVMDVDDIPDAEIVIDDIIAAEEDATGSGDDDVPSDVGAAGP